jgi:hypothetical protein
MGGTVAGDSAQEVSYAADQLQNALQALLNAGIDRRAIGGSI